MKLINLIFIIFGLVVTTSCGFKVMNNFEDNKFTISKINSTGQKRINYKIKNYFNLNIDKKSKIKLLINLDTTKVKTVKEKNRSNQITKYEIVLKSVIEFKKIGEEKQIKFSKSVSGDFIVNNQYSITINNEKKLIDDLIKSISKEILNEIYLKLNDL